MDTTSKDYHLSKRSPCVEMGKMWWNRSGTGKAFHLETDYKSKTPLRSIKGRCELDMQV